MTAAFARIITTQGPALPIDAGCATAAQVLLILAEARSWNDAADDEMTDLELLASYRDNLCLPGHWSPGATVYLSESDDDEENYSRDAWVAFLTPRTGTHHTAGYNEYRSCVRCYLPAPYVNEGACWAPSPYGI